MEYNANGNFETNPPRNLPKLDTNGQTDLFKGGSYLEMSHSGNGRKKKKKKSGTKRHKRRSERLRHSLSQTDLLKRVDYVLVYKEKDEDDFEDKEERGEYLKIKNLRERFQNALVNIEKVCCQEMHIGGKIFVKLSCPFARLCQEAEDINLEMPLKGADIVPKPPGFFTKLLKTDDEVDFVSAPFQIHKRSAFEGIENKDTFFRPSQRSFLLHNILINMDIRESNDMNEKDYARRRDDDAAPSVQGLPYMLLKKVYTDAFVLHEDSLYENLFDDELDKRRTESKKEGTFIPAEDPREELHRTWCKCCKYQPLWKIRNYFGEQIAFYFAWAGSMATALWIPMILGIGIWAYGLYISIKVYVESSTHNISTTADSPANVTHHPDDGGIVTLLTEDWLNIFRNSFDNRATPYFALVICLWGTIFLEYWKRRSATLAYEWDVNTYQFSEPDRPQFFGTKERKDPVSDLRDWYYPFHRQFLKYSASCSILLFMVLLVIASLVGIISYRVIIRYLLQDYSSILRVIVASFIATLINSCVIMILGKIYEKVAVKLTDWENHRTQSKYEDALIIKLFAFSFVNTYSSLFYIAFFRQLTSDGGLFHLGDEFEDKCDNNNCMAMLSLQVFVLMVMKPSSRFFKDIILPFLKKLIRKYKCWGKNKVGDVDTGSLSPQGQFIQKEYRKPPVGNFTLGEYNEKVILYGFLMFLFFTDKRQCVSYNSIAVLVFFIVVRVFSSALPIAPLIALLIILIDLGIDARRLIWFNRRPVGLIACNIGMWHSILEFLNYVGVITNAFIIAFTSQWGKEFSMVGKLWIVIGFEHVVFGVKFILAYIIPDIPAEVSLAMRRERYQVARIMGEAKEQGPIECKDSETDSPSRLPVGFDDNYAAPISISPPKFVYDQDGNTFVQGDESTIHQNPSKKKKKKKKSNPSDPHYPFNVEDPAYPPQVVLPNPPNVVPSYGWNIPVSPPTNDAHLAYPPPSNNMYM